MITMLNNYKVDGKKQSFKNKLIL